MSLLKTAVKARIALIAARTDDPAGFHDVATEVTGRKIKLLNFNPSKISTSKPTISQVMEKDETAITDKYDLDWKITEQWLLQNNAVLIIINPPELDGRMLDVGFVPVPVKLIQEFVELNTNAKDTSDFISALSGLSLQNAERITRMAMAESGEFTPRSLRAMRKQFFQTVRGLEEIATDQLFYEPPERLKEWLEFEGRLFKAPTKYQMLTPRGFLFDGDPGTGKTSGAKYLANQLSVPLYKLDMGAVLSKWAGEADRYLTTALKQAESFEPCILLIDEVEKLFEQPSDLVNRLLGHLLWWLQEHTSKVLVVMTTNHKDKIPPELYREGRIDEVVKITGLTNANLLSFMRELAKKLSHIAVVPTEDLEALFDKLIVPALSGQQPEVSQSRVTEQVLKVIKLKIVQQMQGA